MTRNLPNAPSSVISSSVMPSAKYSCDGSPERFSKGRTAMESMRGGGRGLRKYQIAVVETPMKAIAPTSSIHFRKCFALGLGRPRLNRPRKCCALYARCAAAIGHWILLRRRYARDEPVAAPGQGFNEFRRIGLVAEYFA